VQKVIADDPRRCAVDEVPGVDEIMLVQIQLVDVAPVLGVGRRARASRMLTATTRASYQGQRSSWRTSRREIHRRFRFRHVEKVLHAHPDDLRRTDPFAHRRELCRIGELAQSRENPVGGTSF
jgi:hypothetical protein